MLEGAAGLAVAAVGVVLTLRPFTSLSVLVVVVAAALVATGLAMALAARRDGSRWKLAAAALWVLAGILAIAWPSITTRGLALVVGLAMVVVGVVDVVAGLKAAVAGRLAAIIGGLASVVFGVLALAWPDVTLLVVAVVFGARTVLFGLRMTWSALRDHDEEGPVEPERPAGVRHPVRHLAGVSIALVAALLLAGLSVQIHRSTGTVDAFYDPLAQVPSEPGRLLRAEPFTRGMPAGAVAQRILYTTTREEGRPVVASALVVAPAAAEGPLPVIAWAHGTTGVARHCAPTIMPTGLEAGALFLLDQVLAEGWALVATDYIGLGTAGPHPYLVGEGEARSVLDAVRAARELDEVDLADQTVVWGHSQGGGAALWTGQLAPTYAPDLTVSGVAALAPAGDLLGLVDSLSSIPGGSIFAGYVVAAYAAVYDDLSVGDLVRPAARPSFDRIAGRCLDATALASVLTSAATGMSMFARDVTERLEPRLEENIPSGPFAMPVLVGQGADDSLVLPAVQERFVARLCAEGETIEYRSYPGLGHVPLVEAGSPLIADLLAWTHARFDGDPGATACRPG